jgi:hypothetical protein
MFFQFSYFSAHFLAESLNADAVLRLLLCFSIGPEKVKLKLLPWKSENRFKVSHLILNSFKHKALFKIQCAKYTFIGINNEKNRDQHDFFFDCLTQISGNGKLNFILFDFNLILSGLNRLNRLVLAVRCCMKIPSIDRKFAKKICVLL